MGKRLRKRRMAVSDPSISAAPPPVPPQQEQTGIPAQDDDLTVFASGIALLLFIWLIGWGFVSSASEVFRIVTTGSNCPMKHCTNWAEDPHTLKVHLIGSGLFALFSGAIVVSAIWTLLFGLGKDTKAARPPAAPPTTGAKPRRRRKRR